MKNLSNTFAPGFRSGSSNAGAPSSLRLWMLSGVGALLFAISPSRASAQDRWYTYIDQPSWSGLRFNIYQYDCLLGIRSEPPEDRTDIKLSDTVFSYRPITSYSNENYYDTGYLNFEFNLKGKSYKTVKTLVQTEKKWMRTRLSFVDVASGRELVNTDGYIQVDRRGNEKPYAQVLIETPNSRYSNNPSSFSGDIKDPILELALSSKFEIRLQGIAVAQIQSVGGREAITELNRDCPSKSREEYIADSKAFHIYHDTHKAEIEARADVEDTAFRAEIAEIRANAAERRRGDNAAAMQMMTNGISALGSALTKGAVPAPTGVPYPALSAPHYTPGYESGGAPAGSSSTGSGRQNCGSAKYGCGVNGKGELVDARGNVYGKANDPYTGQPYKALPPQTQDSKCKEYVYYTDGTKHCKAQPSRSTR